MQNKDYTSNMNSVTEDKNCAISSFNCITDISESTDVELNCINNKFKTNAKCDKCSDLEIHCAHVKQDNMCSNKENNFLNILNEDNGFNTEIENEQTSSESYLDKLSKMYKLEEEYKSMIKDIELVLSQTKTLDSIQVEEDKRDTTKTDNLKYSKEEEFLKIADADNGLDDEIERCIKFLTPENVRIKTDNCINDHTASESHSRKRLKLENDEFEEETSLNDGQLLTSSLNEESKTKSSNIELLTFENKKFDSINEEVLNIKKDITTTKTEILEFSDEEDSFLIIDEDNGLNAEMEECIKLLTPENNKNKIRNVNVHVENGSRKGLKLKSNDLKEKTILANNQNKSRKTPALKEKHEAKSVDSKLVASKTNKGSSDNVKVNKEVTSKVDVFEFGKDNFLNKTDKDNHKIGNFINDHKSNEIPQTKHLKSDKTEFKEKILLGDENQDKSENNPVLKEEHKTNSGNIKLITFETLKSDSVNVEEKKNNIIKDYYEDEKDDLKDPGWLKVKELSTDEERYQQVKLCWGSASLNPNKNLTYHSYRKRLFSRGGAQDRQIKQHKRQASANLNGNQAKRARPCTYLFDDQINSLKAQKEKKTEQIMKEMKQKINMIDEFHCQKIAHMRSQSYGNYELNTVRGEYEREVEDIRNKYHRKAWQCDTQYQPELNSLKLIREEVLQFYSVFKGMHTNEQNDPTMLSDTQLQELEEIEKIYAQMDRHYK